MKTTIQFFAFISLIFHVITSNGSSITSQKNNLLNKPRNGGNDLKKENFKSNVKVVTECSYKMQNKLGEFVKAKLLNKTKSVYNKYGNKIEEDGDDLNHMFYVIKKKIYKYDNKGNRTEVNYYSADGRLGGKDVCLQAKLYLCLDSVSC